MARQWHFRTEQTNGHQLNSIHNHRPGSRWQFQLIATHRRLQTVHIDSNHRSFGPNAPLQSVVEDRHCISGSHTDLVDQHLAVVFAAICMYRCEFWWLLAGIVRIVRIKFFWINEKPTKAIEHQTYIDLQSLGNLVHRIIFQMQRCDDTLQLNGMFGLFSFCLQN